MCSDIAQFSVLLVSCIILGVSCSVLGKSCFLLGLRNVFLSLRNVLVGLVEFCWYLARSSSFLEILELSKNLCVLAWVLLCLDWVSLVLSLVLRRSCCVLVILACILLCLDSVLLVLCWVSCRSPWVVAMLWLCLAQVVFNLDASSKFCSCLPGSHECLGDSSLGLA